MTKWRWPFWKREERHLILYEEGRIPESQISGLRDLSKYDKRIYFEVFKRQKTKLASIKEIPTPRVVWIQSIWDTPETELRSLIEGIRSRWPTAKIVYLDWFAPTDLRQSYLFEICDAYVKKHVLKDREFYSNGFADTNLVEYEAQWNKSFLAKRHEGIPKRMIDKMLIVGWNFATDQKLLKEVHTRRNCPKNRSIDVHCRIGGGNDRSTWYGHMRGRCIDAAKKIDAGHVVVDTKFLEWKKYLNELSSSKICFSPFGYGEVCWRDFEAVSCGAVLVKQDMSHIETWPNLYIPYKTYIPVRWDLHDLNSVCKEYLSNELALFDIAENARLLWLKMVDNKAFKLKHIIDQILSS